jgi:hypothetical protein
MLIKELREVKKKMEKPHLVRFPVSFMMENHANFRIVLECGMAL